MAIHSEPGRRRWQPFGGTVHDAAQPDVASSVVWIVLLIAALVLASWIFYGRNTPTPEANSDLPAITQPAPGQIAPRPNPMPSLAPKQQPQ